VYDYRIFNYIISADSKLGAQLLYINVDHAANIINIASECQEKAKPAFPGDT